MAISIEKTSRLSQRLKLTRLVTPETRKAFTRAMLVNDYNVNNLAENLGLRSFQFSPDFFRLSHWMELSDEALFNRSRKRQYFSEVVLGNNDKLGWRDRPEETALKHGTLIMNIGELALIDPPLRPYAGAFLFWETVKELPYYAENDPRLKKQWYLTKDLIMAMILYHNPDNKHQIEAANRRTLVKAGINVPKFSNERFRKIAIIASLIDTAVTTLEQNDYKIGPKLERRIDQFRNKLRVRHKTFSREELDIYRHIADEIARTFPITWRTIEF